MHIFGTIGEATDNITTRFVLTSLGLYFGGGFGASAESETKQGRA
jgi:hypothetical protein